MTDKQIVNSGLDAFLISDETQRALAHLISEVKDAIGIRLETPDTRSVILNKIEYQIGPGDNKELKIRPYVLIALNNTSGSESDGRVKVIHIYNKTSIYLAAIGLGGLLGFAFFFWYLVQGKSPGGYSAKRRILARYWPLTFKWE